MVRAGTIHHAAGWAASLGFLLATSAASGPAAAQDACSTFKWSLQREHAWLSAPYPSLTSGDALAGPAGAATVALRPVAEIAYPAAPEHAPAAGTYGATLALPAPDKAGRYQITLGGEAWLDVVQDGKRLKSVEYSGRKGCPGLRKSVRFDLGTGTATLQISGSAAPSIDIAVGPAS